MFGKAEIVIEVTTVPSLEVKGDKPVLYHCIYTHLLFILIVKQFNNILFTFFLCCIMYIQKRDHICKREVTFLRPVHVFNYNGIYVMYMLTCFGSNIL